MLYVTFPVAALIELLAPVALAVCLTRRLGASWLLVGVGTLTFIGSQVVHIPLNYGLNALGLLSNDPTAIIRTAIVLGLSAGLCEETARATGCWLLKDRARTWQAALTLGAGHGGIESILVGAAVLLTFVNMLSIRNVDLSTLGLTGGQLTLVQRQAAEYWAQPWHIPFTGAVERLSALTLHLSLSVLVLQAFTRRNGLYYVGAVLWHASVNALAVILLANHWDYWAIEGVLAGCALISLGIVWVFRRGPPDTSPEPPATALQPIETLPRPVSTDALREQLERSKFDS